VPRTAGSSTAERSPAAFYFDLGSPQAYLVAERILHVLGPVEWTPVLASALPGDPPLDRTGIELCAARQGVMPIRWPDTFPFDSSTAMLAATYAKSIGRTVPFAQAAFRQAFAGGRSLAELDNVLIAAAACEMHPKAVLAATRMASVCEQLDRATAAASVAGVSYVPAVRVGDRVFAGEDAPERALRAGAGVPAQADAEAGAGAA
jgi:2-hydroxychromene-2-carboxylate isomerase